MAHEQLAPLTELRLPPAALAVEPQFAIDLPTVLAKRPDAFTGSDWCGAGDLAVQSSASSDMVGVLRRQVTGEVNPRPIRASCGNILSCPTPSLTKSNAGASLLPSPGRDAKGGS